MTQFKRSFILFTFAVNLVYKSCITSERNTGGLMAGLDHVKGLFNLNNSMIL